MTRSLHLRCGRRYKRVIFLEKESSTSSFGFEDEEDAKERFYIRRNVKVPGHFDTVGYQPPGRNLAELTSEINLLRSQLQKIKCMHKGNKPPQSMFWETSTSETVEYETFDRADRPRPICRARNLFFRFSSKLLHINN